MDWTTFGAYIISLAALSLNAYTQLWQGLIKPFRINGVIQGLVWRESPLPGVTPFSIILSVVLRNVGAQSGAVHAAMIRIVNPKSHQELRLESFAQIDVATELELVDAPDDSQKARALKGIGSYIPFEKYESKSVSLLFAFPPADAKRFDQFTKPDQFWGGESRLELWVAQGEKGRWVRCHDMGVAVTQQLIDEIAKGRPMINLSGAIFDSSPGAPASETKPQAFSYAFDQAVTAPASTIKELRGELVIMGRWRSMDIPLYEHKENQKGKVPRNYYHVRLKNETAGDNDGPERIIPEEELQSFAP